MSQHLGKVKMFVDIVRRNVHVQREFCRKRLRDMAQQAADSMAQVVCFQRLSALRFGTPRAPFFPARENMIEFEVPEIRVYELVQLPAYSICRACHRSFHAKSEDQLSLESCDSCFHALRFPEEAIPTVHVKVLPRR